MELNTYVQAGTSRMNRKHGRLLHQLQLVLKLANETEQAYALDLAHKASLAQQGDPLPDDFPKALVDMIED